ncbi:MAG: hypothetical protein FJ404_14280, partial [Verrucomicrobia bacterium]|nr:hypothetical protein [Verrucomicrobiota bacterium]
MKSLLQWYCSFASRWIPRTAGFLFLTAMLGAHAQEHPTIVDVPNQAMFWNSTKMIPVIVGTNPAVAGTWTVSASSSDTTIVPNEAANLFVSGSGTNRLIFVRPTLNRFGKTTIRILALDSLGRQTNDVFTLDVRVTNAPPV